MTVPRPVVPGPIDSATWGIPLTDAVNALTDTPRIYSVDLGGITQGAGWATVPGSNVLPVTPPKARRWLLAFNMVAASSSPANATGFARVTVNGTIIKQATMNLTAPNCDVAWFAYFAGAINTVLVEYTAAAMAPSRLYYLDGGPI